MAQNGKSLTAKYLEITAVIALYWFVSISMVFLNKYLLSGRDVKFDAPLFVTFYQCFCVVIFCLVMDTILRLKIHDLKFIGFPRLHFKPQIVRRIFPLSVVFVLMITFNNLCLRSVGVAFYFVGRSLTTVFNVILTFLILKTRVSTKAIICCGVIVAGFLLGVDQEGATGLLTFSGILYGILASFFVSQNSILTKKALPLVDDNIWQLNFYNNVNACILFIFLIIVSGEFKVVYAYEKLTSTNFILMMTLSGIFGIAISFVTGLQIKVTSPLTHNISGTAKACAQTLIAVQWYHETKSFSWWLSNLMVIFGSAAYTRVQQLEMARDHHNQRNRKTTQLECVVNEEKENLLSEEV